MEMLKSIRFRDLMAFFVGGLVIPGIWIAQGMGILDLAGVEILGATVAIETLIAQFYFRKQGVNGTNG